jgi:Bacteriophage holin family HP1
MNDIHSKTSYLTSSTLAIYGLTVNELVAVVGGLCAVGTFLVNWYDKRKRRELYRQHLEKEISGETANN